MDKDLYINESNEEYDALVIGSGISGGWAALKNNIKFRKSVTHSMMLQNNFLVMIKIYPTQQKKVQTSAGLGLIN